METKLLRTLSGSRPCASDPWPFRPRTGLSRAGPRRQDEREAGRARLHCGVGFERQIYRKESVLRSRPHCATFPLSLAGAVWPGGVALVIPAWPGAGR